MKKLWQIIGVIIGLNLSPAGHAGDFGKAQFLGQFGQPELVARPGSDYSSKPVKFMPNGKLALNINPIINANDNSSVTIANNESSKKNNNQIALAPAPQILSNSKKAPEISLLPFDLAQPAPNHTSNNNPIKPKTSGGDNYLGWQYAPGERKNISQLTIEPKIGGAVVSALIDGGEINPKKPVATGQLLVTGWAGDMLLGAQFHQIYFAQCGQIIAQAPVAISSPQIAQSVHSNLTNAGFMLKLSVQALPRCADTTLQAFVQSPETGNYYRIAGSIKLNLTGAEQPQLALRNPILPINNSQSVKKMVKIDLSSGLVPLYSCASEQCPLLGYLESFEGDSGSAQVAVREEKNGWKLIHYGALDGWIQ